MSKINLIKNNGLRATLEIDIKDYYQAYVDFCTNPTSQLHENNYVQQRNLFLCELSNVNGELLWNAIKGRLAAQCDVNNENENEKLLASLLRERNETKTPMVIQSLNTSFIELLKNTVDAALKHRSLNSANELFHMYIDASLEADDLVIEISDNAGGFPDDYLNNFEDCVINKHYKSHPKSSDKRIEEITYYFGGAGRGLPILLNYLLDGEIMARAKSTKKYDVYNTAVHIENIDQGPNNRIGAKLKVRSPQKPCQIHEEPIPETKHKPMPDSFFAGNNKLSTANLPTLLATSLPLNFLKELDLPLQLRPVDSSSSQEEEENRSHPET